jgi:hypothetical protein
MKIKKGFKPSIKTLTPEIGAVKPPPLNKSLFYDPLTLRKQTLVIVFGVSFNLVVIFNRHENKKAARRPPFD